MGVTQDMCAAAAAAGAHALLEDGMQVRLGCWMLVSAALCCLQDPAAVLLLLNPLLVTC
jgi:hypothetical protein